MFNLEAAMRKAFLVLASGLILGGCGVGHNGAAVEVASDSKALAVWYCDGDYVCESEGGVVICTRCREYQICQNGYCKPIDAD
jgi:hypothetical protein